MQKVKLIINGMHCTNCAANLEKQIQKINGVQTVSVNFALGLLSAEISKPATIRQVKEAAEQLGFSALDELKNDKEGVSTFRKVQLIVAIVATLPLVLSMSEPMFGFKVPLPPMFYSHTLHFILASIVQFFSGYTFYKEAWQVLKNGAADMSVLVVLGTTAAYGLSIYNTFVLDTMGYFESSAMIITFVLVGKYLEGICKNAAGNALKELLQQQPEQAIVVTENGEQIVKPISAIKAQDILLIKSGEKIPVDGTVIKGQSAVDESTLTGESLPVDKKSQDSVYAGTQNTYGTLFVRAVHTGEDTVFSNIIRTLENAQANKASIQRVVDKIANVFVPAILAIAVVTLLLWYVIWQQDISEALIHSIAVLVIACPCALGLATPISILVATSMGAKKGILFKGGEELEKSAKVQAVVFDKTGTLTIGEPTVITHRYYNGFEDKNAIEYILAVEELSEHPLAKSIVGFGGYFSTTLSVERFAGLPGQGAYANVGGKDVYVGSKNLLIEQNVDVQQAQAWTDEQQALGMSIIYASIDGQLAASFAVADTLRVNAKEIVSRLKALGKEVYLLTGDNARSAGYIADMLGIDNVKAQTLPNDKAEFIRQLQAKGIKVAMVGDGVNDSLALSQADLAISLAGSSALAIDTSDITIMSKDLAGVVAALRLGEASFSNIKQNLFWALIYNCVAIPMAVFGFLSPALAGMCMTLSSISVVMNSLRLRRFKF